jgi:acetylornithine deacetylase/succinyl-diaminopimelate desuccinylase-like protein
MNSNQSADPVKILQTLIRFDTTNPPGNEIGAVNWIREQFESAGISSTVLAREANRPNLIARLTGKGNAPPLLLYGHLDVVTTHGQSWEQPPFEGKSVDGFIWGRGALDMKAGDAMFLAAFLRVHQENVPLAGDVILVFVSDEEGGGDHGARYLVEEHAALFKDVRHALGEFGGFSYFFADRKYYPIMVAEKQICALRVIVRGPGGHGSLPHQQGTMTRLAETINSLEQSRLPVHITPELDLMISTLASALPASYRLPLKLFLNPKFTDIVLRMLGSAGSVLEPLVRNTVNATIVQGGEKINVIPSEIQLGLDGRLLPGYSPQDMLAELRLILGEDAEINVERFDPGPSDPDMSLFALLKDMLEAADPDGIPIPFLLAAVSDARFFSQLGIQTYGFIPMNLPPSFNFSQLIHAANERIPENALNFGTSVIHNTLLNYGGYVQ